MNKCEELKMVHAWENTTPNVVYPTYPPQYPNKEETCENCGLKRTFMKKVEEWIEYSDGVERGLVNNNYTVLNGDDVTTVPTLNVTSISGGTGTIKIS